MYANKLDQFLCTYIFTWDEEGDSPDMVIDESDDDNGSTSIGNNMQSGVFSTIYIYIYMVTSWRIKFSTSVYKDYIYSVELYPSLIRNRIWYILIPGLIFYLELRPITTYWSFIQIIQTFHYKFALETIMPFSLF